MGYKEDLNRTLCQLISSSSSSPLSSGSGSAHRGKTTSRIGPIRLFLVKALGLLWVNKDNINCYYKADHSTRFKACCRTLVSTEVAEATSRENFTSSGTQLATTGRGYIIINN